MPAQITAERLNRLLRPRSVALVGAANKSMFSLLAYRNLVKFGLEINPLRVDGAVVEAMDAVVTWTRKDRS